MQIKTTSKLSAKHPAVLTDDALTIPLRATNTITALADHPSEWKTTGSVTPLEKFMESASLLIFYSMSTLIDTKWQ